jgi:hypothetical protein
MSQIKPRIIFSFDNGEDPIMTTDLSFIKQMRIKPDVNYRYIHEATIGTIITLPDGLKAEITKISTNFYDMEYKNEGIYLHGHGARYPYNFEIIYKVRRLI